MKELRIYRNERDYPFIEISHGPHSCKKLRIWVHASLVKRDPEYDWEVIILPVEGAKIFRTEKGSLVIRPETEWNVFYVEVVSGYRGSAAIERVDGGEVVAQGEILHSPLGNLGLTAFAFINSQNKFVDIFGRRSGRRIEKKEVAFRIYADGEEETLITDPEVCYLLEP